MSYCIAFIIMIIIPIYHWYLPPFMILWFIVWLIEIRFRIAELKNIPRNYLILFFLFILFYLWQIVGMTYSDNPSGGWRNIILRISLFLFPVLLFSPGLLIQKKVKTLLRVFAICTQSFVFFCVLYAIYRSIDYTSGYLKFNPLTPGTGGTNYFFGAEFSIFQHPSYLAMYAILSVFISFEAFFDSSVKQVIRVLWAVACFCLLVSIYLLASRAETLTVIIALPAYFLCKFRIRSLKRIVVLLAIIALVVFFILIPVFKSNPRFSTYFDEKSKKELSSKILEESRITIWKSSFNLIRRNFVLGVGTGDIQDELNKEYNLIPENNLAIQKNLNAHNQYIEILLENGVIGIILFLSIFGMMMFISIKEKNTLYLIFVIIVFISFMFETMLNRLAGVSFFSIFAFVLLYSNIQKSQLSD